MPAEISASGTWSLFQQSNPTSQAPGAVTNEVLSQMRDTVEMEYLTTSLAPRPAFEQDIDMFQEVTQFIGLAAANYLVPSGAILVRLARICDVLRGIDHVEDQRVYEQS